MRILFTGGGTVGHVTPIVAVAEEIRRRAPGASLLHVGRKDGTENAPILRAGIREEAIPVMNLTRKPLTKAWESLCRFRKSTKISENIIRQFSPDLVFATGGYVSAPVLFAARRLHVPIALHESNAIPGAALKLFWRRAKFVFLAQKIPGAPKTAKVVGNPLPRAFSVLPKAEAKAKLGIPEGTLLLLSYGGSGGAKKLNDCCLSLMEEVKARERLGTEPKIVYRHATGKKYYPAVQNRYPFLCAPIGKSVVIPYIDEMPLWLSAADLAVTRAGAMTVAELIATETPSILIPSPNVKKDHQTMNAKMLEEAGGAILLPEEDLDEKSLSKCVFSLLSDVSRRKTTEKKLSALKEGGKSPAEKIVDAFISFCSARR